MTDIQIGTRDAIRLDSDELGVVPATGSQVAHVYTRRLSTIGIWSCHGAKQC